MENRKQEFPELVSTLEEIAFMLENDPSIVDELSPRDVIHALDPTMNTWRKALPVGTTQADVWILRHGDPLKNATAAVELAKKVLPGAVVRFEVEGDECYANVQVPGHEIVSAQAVNPASAIMAAILIASQEIEND